MHFEIVDKLEETRLLKRRRFFRLIHKCVFASQKHSVIKKLNNTKKEKQKSIHSHNFFFL